MLKDTEVFNISKMFGLISFLPLGRVSHFSRPEATEVTFPVVSSRTVQSSFIAF